MALVDWGWGWGLGLGLGFGIGTGTGIGIGIEIEIEIENVDVLHKRATGIEVVIGSEDDCWHVRKDGRGTCTQMMTAEQVIDQWKTSRKCIGDVPMRLDFQALAKPTAGDGQTWRC